jgi:tetratricopeptide (TPR) repeat protein
MTNLQRAIELAKGVPDHQVTVFASGVLARCHLRQGNVEKALSVLEQSRQQIHTHRLRGFPCMPVWISLAQAYLLVAEQAEKPARVYALKKAKRACRVALKQGQFDRGFRLAAFRMQGLYEWLRGKRKPAQQWWQRSLEAAKALEAGYELGLTHLEMGRCLREPSHLKQAEAIFVEMGAKFDLAQARKLLQAFSAEILT